MKTKQNLSIICMMLLISSCKDCKQCNYTQYETAPVILEYFGNYKPGNYWIYENQDGTKRDSMWVSEYQTNITKYDKSSYGNCVSLNSKKILINSKYLVYPNNIVKVNISQGIFLNRSDLSTLVEFRDFDTDIYLFYIQSIYKENGFLSTTNKVNFRSYPDFGKIYPFGFELYSKIQNIPMRYYLFASNIGLIQYSTINQTDTFSLIKYLIK